MDFWQWLLFGFIWFCAGAASASLFLLRLWYTRLSAAELVCQIAEVQYDREDKETLEGALTIWRKAKGL